MNSMSNDDRIEALNGLIKLDHDAIEAYEAAIARLKSDVARQRLRAFLEDHRQHTRDLGSKVIELGGIPADGPGLMRFLTQGSVVIGGLISDRGVLMAMSTNEIITNTSYEQALGRFAGDAAIEPLIRRGLEDERRHKAWIDQAIDSDMQSAA